MKKIIINLSMAVLIIMFWVSISYAAALQATISITPDKTEANVGDTVTFTLKLTNVANAKDGIITAVAGKITYDTNFFENITYTGISLNESNGKFLKTDSFSNNSNIGTISLKVKSNATGTGLVTFSELEANDGRDDIDQGSAATADKAINITIKENNAGDNTTENNTAENNTTNNDTTNNTIENNTTNNDTTNNTIENNTTESNNTSNNASEQGTSKSNNDTKGNNSTIINIAAQEKKNNHVLPYTGNNPLLGIIIIAGIASVVFAYKKMKEYKNI